MRERLVGMLLGALLALAGCVPPEVAIEEQRAREAERGLPRDAAAQVCQDVADVLRDLGSAKAQKHYERAKSLAPEEPWLHFAYGEYLRQYRGPGQPLLPKAANEYFQALRKLAL